VLPTVIPVISLVVSLVAAIPVVSVVPAVTIAPGSPAKVDHGRRGIIRGRLIDHRRRVSERIDADTNTHLRACGRGCGKRKSGKD
jgi:hypothetical protein